MPSGCEKIATLELGEVYGKVVVPVGAFCRQHFFIERERRRAKGARTSISVLQTDKQRCCWVPLV